MFDESIFPLPPVFLIWLWISSPTERRGGEREREAEKSGVWLKRSTVGKGESRLCMRTTHRHRHKRICEVYFVHTHTLRSTSMRTWNTWTQSSQNENKPRTHTHTHSHTLMMANNFSTKKHENRFRLIEGVAIATISCWAVPYQLRITDAFHQPIFYFTFALWLDGFEMLCVKGTSDE